MRAYYCEQKSAEWFKLRAGRITASRIVDVMAKLKTDKHEAAARLNYRKELRGERMTGECPDHYNSPYMKWGASIEDQARTAYELAFEVMVQPVGFVVHPTFNFSGASPDSLVDINGGLEIKGLTTANHLDCIEAQAIPEEHIPQLDWNIDCSEGEWWDFMSYDPRVKDERYRKFVKRHYRDDKRIKEIRSAVIQIHEEVEEMVAKLGAKSLPFYEPQQQSSDEMRDELAALITDVVP